MKLSNLNEKIYKFVWYISGKENGKFYCVILVVLIKI